MESPSKPAFFSVTAARSPRSRRHDRNDGVAAGVRHRSTNPLPVARHALTALDVTRPGETPPEPATRAAGCAHESGGGSPDRATDPRRSDGTRCHRRTDRRKRGDGDVRLRRRGRRHRRRNHHTPVRDGPDRELGEAGERTRATSSRPTARARFSSSPRNRDPPTEPSPSSGPRRWRRLEVAIARRRFRAASVTPDEGDIGGREEERSVRFSYISGSFEYRGGSRDAFPEVR